jgi:hypothetical protein
MQQDEKGWKTKEISKVQEAVKGRSLKPEGTNLSLGVGEQCRDPWLGNKRPGVCRVEYGHAVNPKPCPFVWSLEKSGFFSPNTPGHTVSWAEWEGWKPECQQEPRHSCCWGPGSSSLHHCTLALYSGVPPWLPEPAESFLWASSPTAHQHNLLLSLMGLDALYFFLST